jgi:hypothetical protein
MEWGELAAALGLRFLLISDPQLHTLMSENEFGICADHRS